MAPSDPIITPAAELRKRQRDAQFIGYLSLTSGYTAEECDAGLTFFEGPTNVGCCGAKTGACYLPNNCVGGTLTYTYPPTGTILTTFTDKVACTDQFNDTSASVCNTANVYENPNDNTPKTLIFCGPVDSRWSLYRAIATSAASIATAIVTPLASPEPNPDDNDVHHKSKAWIAGAVIGPIVGLALIGALILFLLHRRNKKNKTAPESGGASMAAHPSQPPVGVGGYTDAKPNYAAQPDPYAGQGPHQSYGAHGSPAPQYATPGAYGEPHSPLPQQAYPPDTKAAHAGSPTNRAVELS